MRVYFWRRGVNKCRKGLQTTVKYAPCTFPNTSKSTETYFSPASEDIANNTTRVRTKREVQETFAWQIIINKHASRQRRDSQSNVRPVSRDRCYFSQRLPRWTNHSRCGYRTMSFKTCLFGLGFCLYVRLQYLKISNVKDKKKGNKRPLEAKTFSKLDQITNRSMNNAFKIHKCNH